MNKKLIKIVFTALFMALCCAATLISIPSPASNGYLNLGDCLVILSGWTLGPVYGFLAGGVGSAISDLVLGYAAYAPATLVIKGLMALVAYFAFNALSKLFRNKPVLPRIISGVFSEIIMVGGYFLYDSLLAGSFIPALPGIPGNTVQGLFGIAVSTVIAGILGKTKLKNRF